MVVCMFVLMYILKLMFFQVNARSTLTTAFGHFDLSVFKETGFERKPGMIQQWKIRKILGQHSSAYIFLNIMKHLAYVLPCF